MGYRNFFIFVLIASIPSVIAAWFAPFPNPQDGGPAAGKGKSAEPAQAAA
jgi:PAT family beta-lactamase induction signal transducer AmpG